MSNIRQSLQNVINLLSEINTPPSPPPALAKALGGYIDTLNRAKEDYLEQEKWKDFLAELANSNEFSAKQKIDQLSDPDFKRFCTVNTFKTLKGKASKKIKGRIIQKAIKAKKASKRNPAQPAIPEKRESDIITPPLSSREVTTEAILEKALRLKQQATI